MKFQKFLAVNLLLCMFMQILGMLLSAICTQPAFAASKRTRWISQASPAPPTFNYANGVYSNVITNLTMSSASGTNIYYTLDGSQPTSSSFPYYQGAFGISITSITQVNALAIDGSGNQSTVATVYLCIDPNTVNVYANSGSVNNLLLWLRSDLGILESSGAVSQWVDLSGSSNNASQSTAANQPTNIDEGINELPAVQFSGGSTGQFLQLPSGFANFTAGATFIAVVKPSALANGPTILDLGNGSASDNLGLRETSTSGGVQAYVYSGSTASGVTASSGLTQNLFQVVSSVYDGINTSTLFTNGVQQAQSTSTVTANNLTRSNNFLGRSGGGGNYFQGQIAEILVYNTVLTPSQRSSAEAYLMGKYQILNQAIAAPIISIASGTLTGPTQVAVAVEGDTPVFWTNNGTTPTSASNLYVQPLNIYYSQTLKVVAISNGVSSPVSTASYTLDSTQWPAPSTGGPALQLNITLPRTSIPQ